MTELMKEFEQRIGALDTTRKKHAETYQWLRDTIAQLERERDGLMESNKILERALSISNESNCGTCSEARCNIGLGQCQCSIKITSTWAFNRARAELEAEKGKKDE